MIHDFLCKPQEREHWTDKIVEGISFANVCDKVMTCRTAIVTANELAEYYTTMFLYKSKWMMLLYNIVFLIAPSVYTFGFDVVLPNDKTVEIPLKDKLTRDDRREKLATACNSSNNKKPEPDLDLFINEETKTDITLNDILQMGLPCITVDCGALIGSASSGGSVFAPLIHSNIMAIFLYILFALFLISEVVYRYKRNYSKQTYIENLENGYWEIRKYIPRSLQKAYRMFSTILSCIATALVTIVAISDPEILKDIPFGSLTLFVLVIETLGAAVRKLTYKPKNSPSDKNYTQLLTDSVSALTV
jgi:preprotein translocase subunit SecG